MRFVIVMASPERVFMEGRVGPTFPLLMLQFRKSWVVRASLRALRILHFGMLTTRIAIDKLIRRFREIYVYFMRALLSPRHTFAVRK